jgi:ankyrin repeat protein
MLTRRGLLQFALVAPSAKAFPQIARLLNNLESVQKGNSMDLPEQYPAYSGELIKAIVTVAHFDLSKLKDLIDPHPHIVKSAWDWGFGDWETPLGAACHMGRHDIAEYLLSKGATPSLFSWVLFGDLPMVQEIIQHEPGIQRVGGPHSISLLAHARMGGKQSEAILEYLHSLKDADSARPIALTDEARTSICGTYRFGTGPSQLVEVIDDVRPYQNSPMYTYPPQLTWTRQGTMGRPLFHVGNKVFYPAGAPSIEIRFEQHTDAEIMTVRDGGAVLTASREAKR